VDEIDVSAWPVDWLDVVARLAADGWVRLRCCVDPVTRAALREATPNRWSASEADGSDGHVHLGGLSAHEGVDRASPVLQSFARALRDAIDGHGAGSAPPLPAFNHAEWSTTTADGVGFVTAHRDPPGAGGIIAITTLCGSARFRVWDDNGSDLPPAQHEPLVAHEWFTEDGDLVLLRGEGWPRNDSRCPVHAVESPPSGSRSTLTLRHNRRGFGSPYFD
jgi:hypothetical protein